MRRVLLCAFVMLGVIAAPAHASAGPSPGSSGLGDRLFPQLGNGGYDALHYDVDLRYATSAPTQPIDGTVTMVARATQWLSRFDLDFAGASVGAVAVNGQRASFMRAEGELVITPRQSIRNGDTFLVTVSHYVAVPTAPDNSDFSTEAFFYTPDGSATAGQPNFANYFLPSNDHPSDKATFDFRFDVPAGETAVANGVLAAKWTSGGRTHWVYVQRQPMATELVQLAVGNYDITPDGFESGVFVRDVTAKPITAQILPDLQPFTGPQLAWLARRTSEPALHPQCLDYTQRACPMIAGRRAHYRTSEIRLGAGAVHAPDVDARLGQPAEPWFAVWLRSYEVVTDVNGVPAASYADITPLRIRPCATGFGPVATEMNTR